MVVGRLVGRLFRVGGPQLAVILLAALMPAQAGLAQFPPAPLDPQAVQDQDDMTWDDYRPIPGINWTDPIHIPKERMINIALVVADFEDQPFVITLPKHSDLFGNPQVDPIPREQVAEFYRDFWNKPQAINHFQTVHGYWMELSHGKYGVHFDAYGPYRMSRKMIEYSGTVNGGGGSGRGGGGRGGGASLQGELDSLWRPDSNERQYDLVLRIYAGYDETCVWQEFGEMKFQTRDDIPPEWGNPDPTQPRWSRTRYIDWTSWKAGSYLWSNSSIIQGESSGSIRHEISHAAFSIGDNNNNPYVQPYHRAGSGTWDVMDRGSFNGPGGPHNRWQIPVQYGGAAPAGLMLSQQMKFGFIEPSNVVRLNREELAKSGPVVVKVIPRNVVPGPNQLHGIVVALDGEPGDRTPAQDANTNPLYGGVGYNYYTMEVVQRMGYDSFSPDSGVLLAINTGSVGDRERLPINRLGGRGRGGRGARGGDGGAGEGAAGGRGNDRGGGQRGDAPLDRGGGGQSAQDEISPQIEPAATAGTQQAEQVPQRGARGEGERGERGTRRGGRGGRGGGGRGGTLYFNWVIDAHPEDMNRLDFKRPNGEPVMRTVADYRQLNDALFHAGLNSGSKFEYVDEPNRLHFYVIHLATDAEGIRTYTLGVRSLDGAGPQTRGVELAVPEGRLESRADRVYGFTLRNTGAAAETDPSLHVQDTRPHLDSDIYRLSVAVEGAGWTAQLLNELAAVPFGGAEMIPVYLVRGEGAVPAPTIKLSAASESDPTKTATAEYTLGR
jgi:M6 family metalloprotease-like protein